ncbi:hypothetical protein AMTRI_Chr01g104660 [Amborella trichopoda]
MEGLRKFVFFSLVSVATVMCHFGTCEAGQGEALTKLMKAKMTGESRVEMVQKWESFGEVARALPQHGLKEKDEIVGGLHGQPEGVEFKQYAGYVTLDETAGRALFYYFAEAVDPLSKPLLLWLNGGPGCSSLGYGAMEELGPFRVQSDGKTLYKNRYAWNKVANVLFLESPAGVGYSYSNTTTDYALSGDQRTASDAYIFLINWFERFPEYKNREFYISGESYAGHYVPQLAYQVLRHNQMAEKALINLRGIAMGNAVMNDETDGPGMYEYFWNHALISDETIDGIRKHCDFAPNSSSNSQCNASLSEANKVFDQLDIYDIYAPFCNSAVLTKPHRCSRRWEFDPCTSNYVENYLNLPAVQKAFHANVTGLPYPWSGCSSVISTWADTVDTILPLVQEFIARGIRVLVYSGDTDGRVPVTGTRSSVNKLNLGIQTPWYPWYTKGEVGGYSVIYKGGLTFATVRGAGHEVPSYQPARSLTLINAFLKGKPLPS